MAKHQIIYTSCMRGRDGSNDGQQIFSYDASFSDRYSDEVKSLFSYQVPALPAGMLMTEEIALTMPSSFIYRYLQSGKSSITLNTYLGRDYMGAFGRFGNHLSHAIVCDFEDFDVYPCELFGSPALRKEMKFEEVNNPQPPAFLPVPELNKGSVIDVNSVLDFLEREDRLERYKQMVSALLQFPIEKKRLLLCDERDNVIRWIAALHYAFPLDIAKKVSFTTYEFEPELSSSLICGVIPEGSRYQVEAYLASNRYYVFDFIHQRFSDVSASGFFMDFLDTVFSFSYESLTDFHDFVMSKTSFRDFSPAYSAAYILYHVLEEGLAYISQNEFLGLMDFVSAYVEAEVSDKLIHRLVADKERIEGLNFSYSILVLGFLLCFIHRMSEEERRDVYHMIIHLLLKALHSEEEAETYCELLYDEMEEELKTLVQDLLLLNEQFEALYYLHQRQFSSKDFSEITRSFYLKYWGE